MFKQVTGAATRSCLVDVGVVPVRGKDEHFCVGGVFEDLPRGFEAADEWHGDVHDDDIRTVLAGIGDGLASVLCFADDFKVRLQFE